MQSKIRDSAYQFEEEIVDLSRLKRCPVKVTLQTKALLENLVEVAKSAPEKIEPITVAVHGNVQYVVNGHLRVKALKAARQDSARAHVIAVKNVSDVVRLHIDLNSHGTVNPLGMLDAVQFLKRHGAEHHISARYVDLAKKMLYSQVRTALEEFVAGICKRHERVELPIHVIEWIVRFETEKEQNTATTVLIDSLKHLREPKFAFPTPADLDVIFCSIKPPVEEEKEPQIFTGSEQGKVRHRGMWPSVKKEDAEMLVRGTAYDSVLVCKCNRRMLINTKTLRVSSVRNDKVNKLIKITEEGQARPLYAISDRALEFLNLASAEDVKITKICSKRDLEEFALRAKCSKSVRFIILSE